MKPYIITHMMTTIDGRIDCPVVGNSVQTSIILRLNVWECGAMGNRYCLTSLQIKIMCL